MHTLDQQDYEALEMILERNGWRPTRDAIENIIKEKKIAFWMEEGMTQEEAEQYYEELQTAIKAGN